MNKLITCRNQLLDLHGHSQQTSIRHLDNRAYNTPFTNNYDTNQTSKHCYLTNGFDNLNNFGSNVTLRQTSKNLPQSAEHFNEYKTSCKPHVHSGYCSIYNANDTNRLPTTCGCKNWCDENAIRCSGARNNYKFNCRGIPVCHHDCDYASRITDEEESVFPGFLDGDFRILHRNIPALRRTGVNTNSIRQYYYPDGGWGWIICGVSFLVHVLTTGFQLSYGLLLFYTLQHLHNANGLELLGALNCAVSMLMAPLVVAICKRKSTRLLSVVGGLVLPLGVLFTSFATEFSQILFSYGFVVGIGVAMVRETCTIILGTYFKKKRHFVEMVAMSGEGVGIALFSVILKEGVGETGWRQGLQIVAAMLAVSFFMGFFYRPASLYHPHRRAIEHLKNQQKKMRANKPFNKATDEKKKKMLILDLSTIQSTTAKVLLMISCVSALGIYTPMFLMALHAAKEGSDIQELVILQTFIGIASTIGVVLAGALNSRVLRIKSYEINTKVLSQLFVTIVAVSILLLSFIMGYKGLCILSCIYGIGFGGFRYSLRILALECVKLKQFPKVWGFMRGTESIPVLISVPLTSFLNDYSMKYGRAGYYICSAAAAISGIIIFFIGYESVPQQTKYRINANNVYQELQTVSTALQNKMRTKAENLKFLNNEYDYEQRNLMNRSCVSLNQVDATVGCCGSQLRVECSIPQSNCMRSNSQNEFRMSRFPISYEGEIKRQKPLQRSLSFIQPQYSCEGQELYRNISPYQSAQYYSGMQPVSCTCSPSSNVQNSRSRSVPEGLSSVSQKCSCNQRTSRDFIDNTLLKNQSCAYSCACNKKQLIAQNILFNSSRRYLRRSQSLSRPLQYIEQITTSV